MDARTDAGGNTYIETDRPNGEKTRVTYVPHQGWAGQAVVRIQVRQDDGQLRPGPEIPLDRVGDFVSSIVDLLSGQAKG